MFEAVGVEFTNGDRPWGVGSWASAFSRFQLRLRNLRILEGSGKGYDHFVDGVAWVGSALGLERRKVIGARRPLVGKKTNTNARPLGRI